VAAALLVLESMTQPEKRAMVRAVADKVERAMRPYWAVVKIDPTQPVRSS
jgi:hypothetical protein